MEVFFPFMVGDYICFLDHRFRISRNVPVERVDLPAHILTGFSSYPVCSGHAPRRIDRSCPEKYSGPC
jgi:hypothetical protein